MTDPFDDKKAQAAQWFRSLRDSIVASFEGLEDRYGSGTPGRFEVTPTTRADGGRRSAINASTPAPMLNTALSPGCSSSRDWGGAQTTA